MSSTFARNKRTHGRADGQLDGKRGQALSHCDIWNMYANMLYRKKSRLFRNSNSNSNSYNNGNNYSKVLNKTMAGGSSGEGKQWLGQGRGEHIGHMTTTGAQHTLACQWIFSHDPRSPGPMLLPQPLPLPLPLPSLPSPSRVQLWLLLPEWHVNETMSK